MKFDRLYGSKPLSDDEPEVDTSWFVYCDMVDRFGVNSFEARRLLAENSENPRYQRAAEAYRDALANKALIRRESTLEACRGIRKSFSNQPTAEQVKPFLDRLSPVHQAIAIHTYGFNGEEPKMPLEIAEILPIRAKTIAKMCAHIRNQIWKWIECPGLRPRRRQSRYLSEIKDNKTK